MAGVPSTFGTMCLCTVWLRNRVEAIEFLGGLQTQEYITDSCNFYSDLVASFTNIFSDNCFVHQVEILQTFIRTVAISDVFLCLFLSSREFLGFYPTP